MEYRNHYGSLAQGFNKLLRAMDDMNNFESWAEYSKCYEKFKVMDDMNDIESSAQGSKCCE